MKDNLKKINSRTLFILIILFSLLFVVFCTPIHKPFSGDNSVVPYLVTGDVDNLEEFDANEISHMEDVRDLVMLAITIFLVLLPMFVAKPIIDNKNLKKKIIWFDIILLICLIFFNIFFKIFHMLFFPQGNYSFAADSLLIQTYPLSFFFWMFFFWIFLVNILVIFINTVKFPKK